MQSKRIQYEERKLFSKEEKEYILTKSHRKCCKCGCTLKPDSDNYTTDHFIPISKGGSNDMENLVALCKECNKLKDNYVVRPDMFYRYISEDYMKELEYIYEQYCNDFKWNHFNNYAKEELILLYYKQPVPVMADHYPKFGKCGKYRPVTIAEQEAILKKAKSDDDADIIFNYVKKYNAKYGWSMPDNELKDVITHAMKTGCIYMLMKKNEIIALLPITIEKSKYEGKQRYVYRFNGFPCYYQKEYYSPLIMEALHYILTNLSTINDKGFVVYEIDMPVKDIYIRDILQRYFHPMYENESGHTFTYLFYNIFKTRKELEELERTDSDKTSYELCKEQDFDYFSETLRKSFGLPVIKQPKQVIIVQNKDGNKTVEKVDMV